MNHRVKGCMEIPHCVLMGRGRVLFLHVYLLPQNVNVSVTRSCCEPHGCKQCPREGRVSLEVAISVLLNQRFGSVTTPAQSAVTSVSRGCSWTSQDKVQSRKADL